MKGVLDFLGRFRLLEDDIDGQRKMDGRLGWGISCTFVRGGRMQFVA